MSRLRTITRRTLLVGSAAIAGGVAFGTYLVVTPHDNPLADGLGEGEATFNPWVKVSSEAITLITPHTDVGQGVRSAQAMLIAEEMDLDFGQFVTEPGLPDAAYYNDAFGDEGVPFMPRDDSILAETARSIAMSAIKVIGLQGTGGSTSMPDSWVKLRTAGAVARETLKLAASQRAGVDVAALSTESGAVILPDGSGIPYTDLAAEAALLEPVRQVTLRAPAEWRLIGKPAQRLDIVPKSTGALTFGIDVHMDGMLNATVRINPRKGAALNGFDAAEAAAMSGVRNILHVTNGVAVVAKNTWTAFQAANAISFDWADAPYPAEQADHWAAVEASFTDDRLDRTWRNEGDVVKALGDDDAKIIELEHRAPYVAHQPMEPLSATALVTETRADIWVAHQLPGLARDLVARITGLEKEQVHLHNQYAGGSFGHRLEFENVRYAAEIASQMRDTPVKLTFSREEDFAQDFPRQIAMARASGIVRKGQVETLDLHIASPSPAASQGARIGLVPPGPDAQIVAGAWVMPYAIPNLRVTGYRVPGVSPVSSWRSVGASHAGFFAETALDELIHAAGADPMAERLRLCSYDVARKALDAVAEMSDWGSDLGPNRGRGVALVISFGAPVAEVVEVTNTENGIRIDKVYVAADVGTVIDPINFDNQIKGGMIWGLGHAMNCEITYADGIAEQQNFYTHEGMRMSQCPEIVVRGLENGPKLRGIGEPPVPPAAPALANAIFAATGQRIREMPFNKFIEFA